MNPTLETIAREAERLGTQPAAVPFHPAHRDRFRFGEPIFGRMDERGRFVPVVTSWRTRLTTMLADVLWPKPKLRVAAIDRTAGVVTLERAS